jgi:hypothetical protein
MKKLILAVIVIAVLLIILFFPGGDDTSEIKSVFNELIMSGKEKDLDSVMEHFSLHYTDDYGGTYAVVKKIIEWHFANFDGFDSNYSDLEVSINETEGEMVAVANLSLYVSGIKSGKSIPILGSEVNPDNITVTLEKSILGGWEIERVEGLNFEDIGY